MNGDALFDFLRDRQHEVLVIGPSSVVSGLLSAVICRAGQWPAVGIQPAPDQ